MTKYSYIYPIRNRSNLLFYGLDSLLNMDYDKDKYEVIIADYISDDDIIDVIYKFRGKINMKYLCIDPRRYKYHKIPFIKGVCNPALAQNLAVKEAEGEFIVLTSPEVIHDSQNLNRLDGRENLHKQFLYGRVFEKTENTLLKDKKIDYSSIGKMQYTLSLCDWNKGVKDDAIYFIGVMNKALFLNIGGIDEAYMSGIAFEDKDFGMRVRLSNILGIEYDKDVSGCHIFHSRAYQDISVIRSNMVLFEEKEKKMRQHIVANREIEFGDSDVLIERSTFWRF